MVFKRYRVGIMVIILLFVLNIYLPYLLSYVSVNSFYGKISKNVFENNFRFGEQVDRVVLDAFIYHIKNQDGYKIVFVGDSVIAGATVKNNADTVPAYFQKMISAKFPNKKIRVYNLAMPGNRPSDIYFTIKKLYANKAADLIIMNVNYAFYSEELSKDTPIARPSNFSDVMEYDSAVKLKLKTSPTENWLTTNILNKLNLYNMREELSFYLFGNNLREELTCLDLKNFKFVQENPLYFPQVDVRNKPDQTWLENKPFSAAKLKHWEKSLNIKNMNMDNTGYWFLQKIIALTNQNKIPTVAFFTPINKDMIKEYKLIKDVNSYNHNHEILKNVLAKSKIHFFDYSELVNSNYFHELFHMCAPGNKHLAETVLKDVEDIIVKETAQ